MAYISDHKYNRLQIIKERTKHRLTFQAKTFWNLKKAT